LGGVKLLLLQHPCGETVCPRCFNPVRSSCLLYSFEVRFQDHDQKSEWIIRPSVDEYDAVVDAAKYLSELPGQLEEISTTCPQLTYILQPTWEWICEQDSFSFSQLIQPLPEGNTVGNVDNIIDALLITVQSMLRQCSESAPLPESTTESEEVKVNFIRHGVQTTSLFTALLDLPTLGDQLKSASAHISSLQHASRQQALRRVMPFLSCFLSFAGELLESLARWTRALFKLDYVVCSVVHTLGTQGFCIPPETEEGEATGDEKGHATELGGTGLGEGTGNENVSKEIEDESQVEGLRGEDDGDGEIQREKGKHEENTIEMSEDFGGEIEDVPETEEGDENEEVEKEGEEGPDEQLGKVDKSDAAVDEKLWGDDGGDDDGKGEDELQNDRSKEDQRKDSDVVGKERKSDNEKNDGKKTEDAKQEREGDERDGKKEVDVGDENPPEEMEPPNASGAPMDQHIPDADTLDLPDDMHLDEDQDKQDDHGDDLGMEDISDEEHVANDEIEDVDEERERDHTPKDDPMSVEPQDTEQQPPRAVDESNADEEKDNPNEEENENKAIAQPDLTTGDGDGMSENEPQPKDSAQKGQQGSASTQVEMDIGKGGSSREPEPRKQPYVFNIA
jgi:midasin